MRAASAGSAFALTNGDLLAPILLHAVAGALAAAAPLSPDPDDVPGPGPRGGRGRGGALTSLFTYMPLLTQTNRRFVLRASESRGRSGRARPVQRAGS